MRQEKYVGQRKHQSSPQQFSFPPNAISNTPERKPQDKQKQIKQNKNLTLNTNHTKIKRDCQERHEHTLRLDTFIKTDINYLLLR